MKYLLSILFLIGFARVSNAQESWTIKLNNKVLLTSSKEDTIANTKRIKNFEWRNTGFLEISFKEPESSMWKRSFSLCDETDNPLLIKDSVSYAKIPVATLKQLFAGKKKVFIYSTESPKNPMMMVRSRRLLLCILVLP